MNHLGHTPHHPVSKTPIMKASHSPDLKPSGSKYRGFCSDLLIPKEYQCTLRIQMIEHIYDIRYLYPAIQTDPVDPNTKTPLSEGQIQKIIHLYQKQVDPLEPSPFHLEI